MTALLSVPIYQKISLTSKVMEKKYCFIVCCHAILISSQLSLHGLVIKYHELHGFRFYIPPVGADDVCKELSVVIWHFF